MKKIIGVLLVSFFLLLNGVLSTASLINNLEDFDPKNKVSFDVCRSATLGVQIGCLSSWEFIEGDNAILLKIADYPETTVVIAKTNSSIAFLEQLTRGDLDNTARYAEGFKLEKVSVDGKEALKVKAFSQGLTKSRLADYYFIRDDSLWGLFFSVNPKERWDEVKFLFSDLVDTFHFVERDVGSNSK